MFHHHHRHYRQLTSLHSSSVTHQALLIRCFAKNFLTIRYVLSVAAFCVRIYRAGRRWNSYKISCNFFGTIPLWIVKKKSKWPRYRPGVTQRVGRGIALLFHDRGNRRGWVVSSTPRPHFTPRKDLVPILQEVGWAPGPVWTGGKSRPHRDSIPDRPARSQSLYRLSYPAHAVDSTNGIIHIQGVSVNIIIIIDCSSLLTLYLYQGLYFHLLSILSVY